MLIQSKTQSILVIKIVFIVQVDSFLLIFYFYSIKISCLFKVLQNTTMKFLSKSFV